MYLFSTGASNFTVALADALFLESYLLHPSWPQTFLADEYMEVSLVLIVYSSDALLTATNPYLNFN